jgi:hypothetical protein
MANITTISLDDTGYDTVAVLNANFEALNQSSIARFTEPLVDASGETTVQHNLGSENVTVSVWDSTGRLVYADVQVISANAIKVWFEALFTGRVVVIG